MDPMVVWINSNIHDLVQGIHNMEEFVPISENYFPLLDSVTPSSQWATSYFNSEAANCQEAWLSQFYIDEAVCEYIQGCTDATQFGYNSSATQDDGSCTPFVYGCLNIEYVEYDEEVNTADNSCATLKVFGCDDVNTFNYSNLVTVNGVDANNDFLPDSLNDELINPCQDILVGCTDATFVEYWDSYALGPGSTQDSIRGVRRLTRGVRTTR